MFDRQKKTALVTGASSGMGKEIAKRLIQDGFQVYVAARQIDRMEDLAALGARPLRMDISKGAEIDAAVASVLAEVDSVDVLVNNAGFGLYGPVEDIGLDEARYQFEVNVFGPARLTQLLLPAMRKKKAGTIVNITSMGGKIYTLLGAWYHATKHALEGWSDSLRLELAPFGIKVVVVEPGLIETAFGDVVAAGLLKRSGAGAYAKVAQVVAKTTKASYGHGRGSDPRVIADVVSTAVRSARPRTRYAAGKYAKMMIGIRRWLGDRMFDRLILSQMR
ncbi:MAG: SDR family NAD(P)-dependent oxidoreductase [Mesorhizobium sp.]|uniref:oxidoreductase n=1 Tax=unclassified Mesorhizobium TaxID=325217 RepID=UPI000F7649DF|nr:MULTISPECIES: oxidoreductase [unclassified Mesorhizobium]RVD73185.1 SDR family NAD(P)-dependent oxidoreductase [Mesorhizobium sp. M4A.F.Ca.ET.029.04.2.1]AZO48238.1 oxidoreductase [Mesorhizobium sp. M4B.F.Ca.ET.058.02.1.1]RUX46260.1 SDR family NAD(P)-dependent oxidoreductase [Mesorhizobium sp. M4A.F.Ca.ET.050.02.1.1]RVC44539.1 SDR family NAD(P)-dependent oxidoreductase [Mesorhizobium sp. M4A.F.Ca.ET.090.04.2.1]RVD34689.1 SDR family NAD(P)-dependent oxidoreductase [Mesorhizobium sp. M4A.F.Ca.